MREKKKMPPKERMKIPRQPMPEQPAKERRRTFTEVNQGLTVLGATTEAMRCLECAKPQCVTGCPVNVNIREFVQLITAGDYLKAAAKIREDNVLPAITGRVCPQETQCECCCILGNKFEPVGIGYLERFVADYEREHGEFGLPEQRRPPARRSPSWAAARRALAPRATWSAGGTRSPSSRPCTRSAAC